MHSMHVAGDDIQRAHHPNPYHLRTLVFADYITDPVMDAWRHTLHIQTQIQTQTQIRTKGDIA